MPHTNKGDPRLTTLEHALLGIVGLGEKSAYDIRQLFLETPMMQFSSSPGSIYPALRRLERKGLLASDVVPGRRGSEKRLYRISAGGEAALDAWLRKRPAIRDVAEDVRVLFLKFSFMERRLDAGEVLGFLDALEPLLRHYRRDLKSSQKAFRDMGALHAELGIQHGIMVFSTHIQWLAEARMRIAEKIGGKRGQ